MSTGIRPAILLLTVGLLSSPAWAQTDSVQPFQNLQMHGPIAAIATGTSHPTGNNVPTMDFLAGRINIQKQVMSGGPISPAFLINTDNKSHDYAFGGYAAYQNNPAALFIATSEAGSNGSVGALQLLVQSLGTNPWASQDQGLEITIDKYGTNSTWGLDINNQDFSGLPSQSFAAINEIDTDGDGLDDIRTFYNAFYSNRSALYFNGRPSVLKQWAPDKTITAHGAAYVVYATSVTGVVSTYIPKAAGGGGTTCTTGPTEPKWPDRGTVADGTCIWTYGTTRDYSIGRGIWFDSNPQAGVDQKFEWGTLLAGDAIVENAVVDTSGMTFSPRASTAAAIRLAANQPIDFSGDLTQAGQNRHTVAYGSHDKQLLYTANRQTVLRVSDNGDLTVAGNATTGGHEISTGAAPMVRQTGGSGAATLNATATDAKGTVTEGAQAAGFIVTFHTPYATAPDCIVASPSGSTLTGYIPSTSELTVTNAPATGSRFTYHCFQ